MTQVFDAEGSVVPVTVIEANPCTVVQKKTLEQDGYSALKIAYGTGYKEKNISKAHKGIFAKNNLAVKKYFREFRIENTDAYQIGQDITAAVFSSGDYVDVTGISKGKGFAGTVKRHNFKGGPQTHGQSDRLRAPGSIGSNTYPGRVFKGMKMSGHLGCERVTIQKLEVVMVDPEKNLILIKGSMPGADNSFVTIMPTVKCVKKKAVVEKKVLKQAKGDKSKKAPAAKGK